MWFAVFSPVSFSPFSLTIRSLHSRVANGLGRMDSRVDRNGERCRKVNLLITRIINLVSEAYIEIQCQNIFSVFTHILIDFIYIGQFD